MPTRAYRILLLLLVAVSVVVSLQTVGLGLMLAMLVTPASTAYLVTRRLPRMMLVGALLGIGSGIAGLYLSFYVGISSGAAVVLVAISFFVLVLVGHPSTGAIARVLRREAARGK